MQSRLINAMRRRFLDYADLKGKSFFPGLIKYMASGPVVGMVWQGLDAVKTGRAMLGTTNPLASAAGPLKLVIEFFRWLTLIMQVRSVVITVLQLDVTYAMALTRLRVLKKRLLCKFCFALCTFLYLIIVSWFPEGVVQYTSALEAWVFE
jgi:nucleoside-diphosphate kinase